MARSTGFPVIDIDSHVFEPLSIWEDYLEPEYRTLARSAFYYERTPEGNEVVIVNGEPAPGLGRSKIPRQAIWKPGMKPKDIGALDPKQPHPVTAGSQDPKARLADMDAMGVDVALLLPTVFAEYFPVVKNPDVAAALARAYNDWILDFARESDRLVPAVVLPVQDVTFAVREVQRVAELGAKAAFIRPMFMRRRYLNHPDFDPLWRELEAKSIVACIHPSVGNTNPEWTSFGAFVERVSQHTRPGHNVAEATAPVLDNIAGLESFAFYGHMEDFPNLKFGMLHGGAGWLPLALEKAETYLWLAGQTKPVSLEPEHIFFSPNHVVGFDSWEGAVARMPDLYEEVGVWGSRYPNHDAADAHEAIEALETGGVSGETIGKLMGGNAARFLGLSPS